MSTPFGAEAGKLQPHKRYRCTLHPRPTARLGGEIGANPPGAVGSREREAQGGHCEAWPLARPSEANDFRGVSLYIDEVGALRARPRNGRAEALAARRSQARMAVQPRDTPPSAFFFAPRLRPPTWTDLAAHQTASHKYCTKWHTHKKHTRHALTLSGALTNGLHE